MTKYADDNARIRHVRRGIYPEFDYKNQKVSSMYIKKISVKEAREYIATYHYSKTMPDSTKFVYAGFYGNTLAGIIVYGMGAGKSQYKAIIPTIQTGEYLELTRLWSHDNMPKNTESRLIGLSLKALPTQYKLIVSFADPSEGHVGTIYQATNWIYCGMSNGGKSLITEDGIVKHPRLIGIYRARHKELADKSTKEIMDIYGWKYIESHGKHRYVMLRGSKKELKAMRKMLNIHKYPKKEEL